jgi:hypothetical protein
MRVSTAAALAALCAAAAFPAALAAVPFSSALKLFGYAEKNGRIPPSTELLIFNHTCGSTALPCAITQMHFPSIYPGGGCPWDWESGVVRVYVDGAPAPALNLTLLQLASVGAAGAQGNSHKDISPFAAGHLFGKNAQTGGVWSTVRIPFAASVSVTLTQAASCAADSTYWAIVRGIEGLALQLGEVELPPAARLVQSTIVNTTFAPDEYIPLASAPPGTDGMLLYTFLDATSKDPNYLEGCFHLTSSLSSTPNSTIFLSSGTEDYFLSARCAAERAEPLARAAPRPFSFPHLCAPPLFARPFRAAPRQLL